MKTKQNFVKRGIVGNKDESIEQAILNLEIAYRHCSDIRTTDLIECALNRLGMELKSKK